MKFWSSQNAWRCFTSTARTPFLRWEKMYPLPSPNPLLRIGEKYDFLRKTFVDCLLCHQKMPHPQISRRKLSRIATKPQNVRKFSLLKVSRYAASFRTNKFVLASRYGWFLEDRRGIKKQLYSRLIALREAGSFIFSTDCMVSMRSFLACTNCTKHSPNCCLRKWSHNPWNYLYRAVESVWTRDRLVVFSGLHSVLKRVVDWTTRNTSSFVVFFVNYVILLRDYVPSSLCFSVLHVMMSLCTWASHWLR